MGWYSLLCKSSVSHRTLAQQFNRLLLANSPMPRSIFNVRRVRVIEDRFDLNIKLIIDAVCMTLSVCVVGWDLCGTR